MHKQGEQPKDQGTVTDSLCCCVCECLLLTTSLNMLTIYVTIRNFQTVWPEAVENARLTPLASKNV